MALIAGKPALQTGESPPSHRGRVPSGRRFKSDQWLCGNEVLRLRREACICASPAPFILLITYFSADLGYQASVVNLGFHGYGPHQMLRSLELDFARPLIHGVVRQVVYLGVWSHARRAAGKVFWDPYGPSYALSGDGVAYVGPFHNQLAGFMIEVLEKSHVFRFVLNRTLYRANVTDEDVERYARILAGRRSFHQKVRGGLPGGSLVLHVEPREHPQHEQHQ